MSTFEQSKSLFNQTHFTVIEIDLPVVEGECTISGESGYGTPLTCDQPSNATKTYKFTTKNAPFNMPESGILRLVDKVSETPTKLQTGKGLSSRGTISITFRDTDKKDPNPFSPAVAEGLANEGTYFGKLAARNVLTNKNVRIKNYRVEADGSIDLANGAETRHYIIDSFQGKSKGLWSLKGKDELSRINIGESVWPLPLEGFLRQDITSTQTIIPVDPNVNYQVADSVRVGDEIMKVVSVSGIGGPSAQIGVQARGTDIVYTNTLTTTKNSEHSSGDEVFVCEVSDDERLDDLLERILLDIGIDASFIPKAEWTQEINEWHQNTRVNTLWIESEDTVDALESILTYFMLDMWFDPVDREIKLSAISVWKESTVELLENDQINYDSIKLTKKENLRSTRALVIYDKRDLTTSESIENYNKASLFRRTELESDDFWGEPKTKRFDFNKLLDKDSADLLVNRYVNRFIDPDEYTWMTPERKLDFKVGNVVDIFSNVKVGFNGLPTGGATRGQITSIQPMYKNEGREYKVTALSYEPTFSDNSEIIITGNISDVNLYNQYAGAPSQPITITFILDGVVSSSTAQNIPSIRAGAFPAGSKIILILANGADLMAKGGDGGTGGGIFVLESPDVVIATDPTDGFPGGTVIDAEGVDMDIYFSGATPSAAYPTANGFTRAPSGGDGGFDANVVTETSGNGGDGGDGRFLGSGGNSGLTDGSSSPGQNGENGTDNPATGSYGQNGAGNGATGGGKGSGVVDNGATVVFFGSDANRYINGNGDH